MASFRLRNLLLSLTVLLCVLLFAVGSKAGYLSPGSLIVADGGNFGVAPSIVLLNPQTGAQSTISSGGFLVTPVDVAIDGNGFILVTEQTGLGGTGGIVRVDPATGVQTVLSSGGTFGGPAGIVVAANGDIFIAEPSGVNRIARIDPITGSQSTLAIGGFLDRPVDVTIDSDQSLLVADHFNQIVRVDPITGSQQLFSDLGTGSPRSITIGAAGEVFVADTDIPAPPLSNTVGVRQIDRITGIPTNISIGGNFISPYGIATGIDGTLFVSDSAQRIIAVDPTTGLQTVVSSGGLLASPMGIAVVPIPEPSSVVLLWMGGLLLFSYGWRRSGAESAPPVSRIGCESVATMASDPATPSASR